MQKTVLFAFAALSLTACKTLPQVTTPAATAQSVAEVSQEAAPIATSSANVIGIDGSEIGTVALTDGPHGLLVRVELGAGSLTQGWHGLHLHQVGDCSDTGIYKLSGGHVGKVADGHGLLNPAGPEGGDTPNIYAHADGAAALEFITNRTNLSELRDTDGSALIIHAGPDDHITQPIGGAGARVACAVIK